MRTKINTCEKCDGYGWVWGHELDGYTLPDGMYSDDTKYTCDLCNGERCQEIIQQSFDPAI